MRTGGNPLGSDGGDVVVRCENAVINPRAAVGLRIAKISGAPVNPVTLTPAVIDLSFASLHLQPIAEIASLYSEDLVNRGGEARDRTHSDTFQILSITTSTYI